MFGEERVEETNNEGTRWGGWKLIRSDDFLTSVQLFISTVPGR